MVYKVPSVSHSPSEDTWEALRKEDPNYASLAVHWRLEAEKERAVYIVGGIGNDDRTLCTNAADVMTTCAAIAERMIYAKIGGKLLKRAGRSKEYFDGILGGFKKLVVKAAGRTFHPVTPQEFVDSYTGRKRTLYANYLEDYLESGVQRMHAMFRTFMKVEKVPTGKSPRTIQPRSPIFNIGLGRYLKHAEKPIFRAISRVFGQKYTVFKGLNAVEMGTELRKLWDHFVDPVALGIDASRFDASVDIGLLEHEHSLYNMLFHDKELSRLLRMQLHNVGVAYCHDGIVRYTVTGGRGSGDMNTSLGNSYIMCALIWVWLQKIGVNAKLANNGDDCVVIMERGDQARFEEGFAEYASSLGFVMVVEDSVDEFELIEFCQTHPVFDGVKWRMVRNFDSAREKDSMCLFPLETPGAIGSWLYAVGECGMALTAGIPVFQEMYQAFMRNGKPSKMSEAVFMQSGAKMMSAGMDGKWVEVSTEARVSFFSAFGVTPDEQVALEEYYRSWTLSPTVVVVDSIYDVESSPM